MIPALIAAAASIGGGLIARRAQNKASKANPVLKRVQDAKAAGVHPVYALGATGLEQPRASTAFGDGISRAGQSIGSALGRSLDTDQTALKTLFLEKAGLENELLRTQITRAKQETAAQPILPSLDQRYLLEGQGSAKLPQSTVPGTVLAVPGAHKITPPQWSPNLSMGWPYRTNPHFSDAQTYEDRYGEAMGSILGTVNVGADAWHGTKPSWERTMRGLRRYPNRGYDPR